MNGRPSLLQSCNYNFKIQEEAESLFKRTRDDDTPGLSQNDKEFLSLMDQEFVKTESGNWSAPLPFKKDRPRLPNNYNYARQRAESLGRNLKKNPTKLEHFCKFMNDIFSNGHAEPAPSLNDKEECWYLPIFGVYHNKKPGKIRVVFDSSAPFDGISLNAVLLTGPDLTNNLLGVLMNFRNESVAVMADVQQMFFNFRVHEKDRNFLRFLWYEDNDPHKSLMEYRMTVHVFGNAPSPAVATYGLRKSACDHEDDLDCDDICRFIMNNFYVDDGLVSLASNEAVIDLLKGAKERLMKNGNLRLHKIVSNSQQVLGSFKKEDLAKDLEQLNFSEETMERSLGMCWNIVTDTFTFQISSERKQYT
jgi:hypothetical protein